MPKVNSKLSVELKAKRAAAWEKYMEQAKKSVAVKRAAEEQRRKIVEDVQDVDFSE